MGTISPFQVSGTGASVQGQVQDADDVRGLHWPGVLVRSTTENIYLQVSNDNIQMTTDDMNRMELRLVQLRISDLQALIKYLGGRSRLATAEAMVSLRVLQERETELYKELNSGMKPESTEMSLLKKYMEVVISHEQYTYLSEGGFTPEELAILQPIADSIN